MSVTGAPLAFLFDIDDTLLDNDRDILSLDLRTLQENTP